ncbi:MAG: exodeoxyribonuclease III [Patescibacteria group bacterium]|nr:exodeoxyribonuclease III [Patescibacteria group bacterium]
MKVATWNVNSVRARLDRLVSWLERHGPDIVCLQELKARDDAFPSDAIEAAGYHAVVYGQPTYNGVAILSRSEPEKVIRGMDDGVEDSQARLLAVQVDGVQVVSVYVPNGQVVGSEQYAYKLEWLRRARQFLDRHFTPAMPLLLCGDFNVARDERDVANPAAWAPSVLCHPASRIALEELLGWGLVDVLRHQHPEGGAYSWWDYRNLGFPKNDGLRIDYVFATQSLAARCTAAEIDRQERKGAKPSDHAPVIAVFGE